MDIQDLTQFSQLLKNSKKALITTRRQFTGDGLASCLAIFLILKKLNKTAEIIIDGFNLPKEFQFLPNLDVIKNSTLKLKKYDKMLFYRQNTRRSSNYISAGFKLYLFAWSIPTYLSISFLS